MNDTALLSHEETLALLRRAQDGDEDARDLLVRSNIALVKSIVKKHLNRGVEYEDLLQIGSLGLVKAINNYSFDYDVRFSTYAVPMIAGEIKRFLRDDGMVKVSRSLKELSALAMATQERLSLKLGREARICDIASELNVTEEELVMALEAARPHRSLYEPAFGEEAESCIMDRIEDSAEDGVTTVINRLLLKELLSNLEPRERQLIMMRYFKNKTQTETANVLGVSQVQVSRLESKILRKMKERAQ
ncbi:MAG: SigB/SigF/SigG family RNA polymerase sigma factor [Clostridia bacterium]|nr:SigB/SigF/SigG family RNA polymerase sigma factor [Clostridia bacterium]